MLRLFAALPVAIILVVSVFVLMANLVSPIKNQVDSRLDFKMVDFISVEQEQSVMRRTRLIPEPSAIPKAPTQALPVLPNIKTSIGKNNLELAISGVDIDVGIGLIDINPIAVNNESLSYQATPISRVEPHYPTKAKQRRAEGYVIIQFNIDEHGIPCDLQVIEAQPKRLFEHEALKALKQWRYQERIEQGTAVPQLGQTVKLEFKYPK